ncbi:MAG TPA: hypothetical protein VF791_11560 [Pyrinomonadaceae bacterium]
MPKALTGGVAQDEQGRWFYRYQHIDKFGKRRNVRRLATSESNAKSQLRKAINKHEKSGGKNVEGERLKFSKLASIYAGLKIFEPEYHGDRKIAGLRSYKSVEPLLETLKDYFANMRVATITHADVEAFKLKRLREPVIIKTDDPEKAIERQRSIASVNRELELLRALLRFAAMQGWLERSPFERSHSQKNRIGFNTVSIKPLTRDTS